MAPAGEIHQAGSNNLVFFVLCNIPPFTLKSNAYDRNRN
nr:MAG TPA: YdfZ protein [Caudoviricetes sp.]